MKKHLLLLLLFITAQILSAVDIPHLGISTDITHEQMEKKIKSGELGKVRDVQYFGTTLNPHPELLTIQMFYWGKKRNPYYYTKISLVFSKLLDHQLLRLTIQTIQSSASARRKLKGEVKRRFGGLAFIKSEVKKKFLAQKTFSYYKPVRPRYKELAVSYTEIKSVNAEDPKNKLYHEHHAVVEFSLPGRIALHDKTVISEKLRMKKLAPVIVFGRDTCSNTGWFRHDLKTKGVPFVYYDVYRNKQKKSEMWKMIHQQYPAVKTVVYPVIEISQKIYISDVKKAVTKYIRSNKKTIDEIKNKEAEKANKKITSIWDYRTMYARHSYQSFMKKFGDLAIDPQNVDYELLGAAVFYETNRQRTKRGIKPLIFSRGLYQAAFMHSKDMATIQFFSHMSQVPGRKKVSDRVKKYATWRASVGENIAKVNYRKTYRMLSSDMIVSWLNSPPHKKAMLSKKYRYLGAAVYNRNERYLGTQNFAGGISGFTAPTLAQ